MKPDSESEESPTGRLANERETIDENHLKGAIRIIRAMGAIRVIRIMMVIRVIGLIRVT